MDVKKNVSEMKEITDAISKIEKLENSSITNHIAEIIKIHFIISVSYLLFILHKLIENLFS